MVRLKITEHGSTLDEFWVGIRTNIKPLIIVRGSKRVAERT
jgi:hypothetical protein